MITLALILIFNIGLLFLIANCFKNNLKDERWRQITKSLGILELALGALSFMLGLFLFFELLEKSTVADFNSYKKELIIIALAVAAGILNVSLFVIITVRLLRAR